MLNGLNILGNKAVDRLVEKRCFEFDELVLEDPWFFGSCLFVYVLAK